MRGHRLLQIRVSDRDDHCPTPGRDKSGTYAPSLHRFLSAEGRESIESTAHSISLCSHNKHHKAGNINAALMQTNGEFVVIFDADQVPLPDFIDHTLGYFVDEKMAFVQTGQEFYNLDSVQHKTNWKESETWHEQSLFYNVIQLGKNRWNAGFWCGSNSIMRRSALMSVGGLATETVTEDIHTSLRLHAAGWKSVCHEEVLAMGLAPQDYLAFTV